LIACREEFGQGLEKWEPRYGRHGMMKTAWENFISQRSRTSLLVLATLSGYTGVSVIAALAGRQHAPVELACWLGATIGVGLIWAFGRRGRR